jgi:hypothetical protein
MAGGATNSPCLPGMFFRMLRPVNRNFVHLPSATATVANVRLIGKSCSTVSARTTAARCVSEPQQSLVLVGPFAGDESQDIEDWNTKCAALSLASLHLSCFLNSCPLHRSTVLLQ